MTLEIRSGIAEIILDDLKQANCFGIDQAKQLQQFLKVIKTRNDILGICLSSRSPHFFCSGGNLKQQREHKRRSEAIRYHRTINASLLSLEKFPRPVVAVIDGLCVGGGIELASAADYIIATPAAAFGFWQRRLGLTFGWGGGRRILRRMKPQSIVRHALTTEVLSSFHAQQIGLVDEVTPAWAAQERARAWIFATSQPQSAPDSLAEAWKSWSPLVERKIFERLLWKGANIAILKRREK
jgi:enoyl-CoA hydratase/carnithine racemase